MLPTLLLAAAMLSPAGPERHPSRAVQSVPTDSPCPTSEETAAVWASLAIPRGDSLQAAIDAGRPLDDREAQACWYRVAERIARAEAEGAPDGDVRAQYRLALALGLRADVEGGRTRVRLANELYTQLQTVLGMDPEHPEARHIFGRLHAGVMRMNRVTRFLATRLLGGGALRGASWEEAEAMLLAAERARPDVPDHHFELGRLYEDTDRAELAEVEARHVLDLKAGNAGEEMVQQRAGEMLERLEGDRGRTP